MKTLDFYDLSTRGKFNSRKYTKKSKMGKNRMIYYAIALSPSGTLSSRIISKEDYNSK